MDGSKKLTDDVVGWHADSEFVQRTREQKDENLRDNRRDTTATKWAVDVPAHEACDRLVPGHPVDANTGGIPPLGIELAVTEAHHLSQSV